MELGSLTQLEMGTHSTSAIPLCAGPTKAEPTIGSLSIDWNHIRPDGSEASMRKLLKFISAKFGAQVHIALARSSVVSLVHSSNRQWTKREQPSQLLQNTLLEASFAMQNCLFAAAQNSSAEPTTTTTSRGLLESFREEASLRWAISFAIAVDSSVCPYRFGMLLGFPKDTHANLAELSQSLQPLKVELSQWLAAWQTCCDGSKLQRYGRFFELVKTNRRRITIGALLILAAGVAVPVPYQPMRKCVVEAAERKFIASPIDGRVVSATVRPGDVVQSGDVIGQLDDEQTRWELGRLEAELQAASKRRDTALANRAGGDLRLAKLEQESIALKIESLRAQLARLQLCSPTSGVVLQGDWQRREGAPVTRGEMLFEVAPLNRMTIEAHLTTQDLVEIEVGDEATVWVDSAPGNSWRGSITRIDPRATIIENKLVFVAELEVENQAGLLRPGMEGSLRIKTGWKSLGWIVSHRPYRWLMKNWVW